MIDERSVGLVKPQFLTFAEDEPMQLGKRRDKLGPATIAYETYGRLNAERSNAILIVHALGGARWRLSQPG